MMRHLGIFGAAILLAAFGFGELERGNRLYRDGRYDEAVEAYRSALSDGESSTILHYNLGTALLRTGRYDEAEQHLRAALASIDPQMRERTHYNLGSRFLDAARITDDPRARAQLLDAAVEAYKQALRVNPADVDAKWNLELALREQDEQPPVMGGGDDQGDEGDDDSDGDGGGASPPGPAGPSPGANERRREYADSGEMTPEQAERILRAAEQSERDLYRDKLRQGRRDTPVARDW